jgi:hypothetical protein
MWPCLVQPLVRESVLSQGVGGGAGNTPTLGLGSSSVCDSNCTRWTSWRKGEACVGLGTLQVVLAGRGLSETSWPLPDAPPARRSASAQEQSCLWCLIVICLETLILWFPLIFLPTFYCKNFYTYSKG